MSDLDGWSAPVPVEDETRLVTLDDIITDTIGWPAFYIMLFVALAVRVSW